MAVMMIFNYFSKYLKDDNVSIATVLLLDWGFIY